MTPTVLRNGLGLAAWAASLAAALSIAQWPGDWGHGICGPWGCGPPLQALVACHLAWFVIVVPPSVAAHRSARVTPRTLRNIGVALCIVAALYIGAVVIDERMTWWPMASEWQQDYFWHRCGFVLVTTTDLPVVQVLVGGVYLITTGQSRILSDRRIANQLRGES